MSECLVCDRSLEAPSKTGDYGGRKSIKCPRCGNFEIAGLPLLEVLIRQMQKKERMRLSAWIRTKRPSDFVITNENLEDIVQSFPNYRVLDQQLLLLRHLEDMTNHPGGRVQVDLDDDFPVIWAHNNDELLFHLRELARRGFIGTKILQRSPTYDPSLRIKQIEQATITTDGWAYLDDHPAVDVGNQAFVAMSFSEAMGPAFSDGIKPALEKAGYDAYRVDLDPHVQRIDAKIEHEIRNSVFVVADVTEQKQGVYYEAGFAMGLGRPVIWTVKEEDKEDLHFDTRQYRHIIWTDVAELREQLYHLVSVLPDVRRRRPHGGP